MNNAKDGMLSNELEKYAEKEHIFQKNDPILVEHVESDNSIYLLRQGSVGVYRTVDGVEVLIDCIDAVNFFGELEMYHAGPRLGTVRVLSTSAVIYQFLRSDIPDVLSTPGLNELLVMRLSQDLGDFSNRFVKNETGINRLLVEKESTIQNLTYLFKAIFQVLTVLSQAGLFSNREIGYMQAIIKMTKKYLAVKAPEFSFHLEKDDTRSFRKMYEEDLIPKELVEILLGSS
jgi:CRP-like cAMP-binding protein